MIWPHISFDHGARTATCSACGHISPHELVLTSARGPDGVEDFEPSSAAAFAAFAVKFADKHGACISPTIEAEPDPGSLPTTP